MPSKKFYQEISVVAIISVLAAVISIFANVRGGVLNPFIPAFSITNGNDASVLDTNYQYDRDTIVNAYNIGDISITSANLAFNCVDKNNEFVAPQPSSQCWSASLNGQQAMYGQTLDFPFFTAQFLPQGHYVRDLGFLNLDDWKNNYFITLKPNVITLKKSDSNPFLIHQNEAGKYSIILNSKINNLPAGVVIKETRGMFFNQNSRVQEFVLHQGDNVLSWDVPSNVLGMNSVDITPFVRLYDYGLGLSGNDAGLCFKDRKQNNLCVQQKRVALLGDQSQPLHFDFNVVQQGIDLSKNLKTSCVTTVECPTGFSCQNNICSIGQTSFVFNFWNWLLSLFGVKTNA